MMANKEQTQKNGEFKQKRLEKHKNRYLLDWKGWVYVKDGLWLMGLDGVVVRSVLQ